MPALSSRRDRIREFSTSYAPRLSLVCEHRGLNPEPTASHSGSSIQLSYIQFDEGRAWRVGPCPFEAQDSTRPSRRSLELLTILVRWRTRLSATCSSCRPPLASRPQTTSARVLLIRLVVYRAFPVRYGSWRSLTGWPWDFYATRLHRAPFNTPGSCALLGLPLARRQAVRPAFH